MSTRCNVIIKKKGYNKEILYHHYDGYPEGVGEELEEYVTDFSLTPREVAEKLNAVDSQYELDEDIHGDIEYLYTIDLDDRVFICETEINALVYKHPFNPLTNQINAYLNSVDIKNGIKIKYISLKTIINWLEDNGWHEDYGSNDNTVSNDIDYWWYMIDPNGNRWRLCGSIVDNFITFKQYE